MTSRGIQSRSRSCVIFAEYLTGKRASPTNQCWCQKTRVIALSCGINISAVHHLVLSQYTHLTDRLMDRQNCDSNTMRCITCSRTVKWATTILGSVRKNWHQIERRYSPAKENAPMRYGRRSKPVHCIVIFSLLRSRLLQVKCYICALHFYRRFH